MNEFLYKSFEDYTVVEGFLLLFLILWFITACWRVIKEVL